jgi:hypothetical protein
MLFKNLKPRLLYPIFTFVIPSSASDVDPSAATRAQFMATGTYGVPYLFVRDDAGNQADTWFSAPAPDTHEVAATHQPLVTIEVDTADADVTPPEIDVNRIAIRGAPTKPHAPDGETLVRTSPRQTSGSGPDEEAVFLRAHEISSTATQWLC